jgi:hypothetical protein
MCRTSWISALMSNWGEPRRIRWNRLRDYWQIIKETLPCLIRLQHSKYRKSNLTLMLCVSLSIVMNNEWSRFNQMPTRVLLTQTQPNHGNFKILQTLRFWIKLQEIKNKTTIYCTSILNIKRVRTILIPYETTCGVLLVKKSRTLIKAWLPFPLK